MSEERTEKTEEQKGGSADREATVRLDKSDVDEVAGGAGKQSYDKPPELPEIM